MIYSPVNLRIAGSFEGGFVMRTIGLTLVLAGACAIAGQALAGAERITFPSDYKSEFVYFLTSDRPDNNTVRDLYASLAALESAKDGAPLDHGSQFVMEVYAAVVDDADEPVLDADGRMQKANLKVVAVMEKQPGWGESYAEDIRNGDWEFGFFTGDGALKADVDTRSCMECHLPFADDDYVIYLEDLVNKANE